MQMWTLSAPQLLSYLVTVSGTKSQKQQQRSACSEHFFFPEAPKITVGKLQRGRMLDLRRCWFYMQAAGEGLCAQISRSCLMSYVLNTLLSGVSRPSLSPLPRQQTDYPV